MCQNETVKSGWKACKVYQKPITKEDYDGSVVLWHRHHSGDDIPPFENWVVSYYNEKTLIVEDQQVVRKLDRNDIFTF